LNPDAGLSGGESVLLGVLVGRSRVDFRVGRSRVGLRGRSCNLRDLEADLKAGKVGPVLGGQNPELHPVLVTVGADLSKFAGLVLFGVPVGPALFLRVGGQIGVGVVDPLGDSVRNLDGLRGRGRDWDENGVLRHVMILSDDLGSGLLACL
jgi:hypothetical protein